MEPQDVKISELSYLSSDLRMVIVKDDKPILKETKFTKFKNTKFPKKLKAIINYGVEVEKTTTNKLIQIMFNDFLEYYLFIILFQVFVF